MMIWEFYGKGKARAEGQSTDDESRPQDHPVFRLHDGRTYADFMADLDRRINPHKTDTVELEESADDVTVG